jgi:uncharacterized protein (DUF433 family)
MKIPTHGWIIEVIGSKGHCWVIGLIGQLEVMQVFQEITVMEATVQSINLIGINENVRNGRPYIIGTTVTVADIAIVKIYHEQDADGIAEWFDLTLPQVYAALAYYYEHQEEMDGQIRAQIQRAKELKENRVGDRHRMEFGV